MKKVITTLLLLLTLLPSTVLAHVLKTDGTIGAVMHIDPGDDPIVGQPATFYFEFKDKDNRFDPAACTCQFSLSENGGVVYAQPLFAAGTAATLNNALVTYTFTRKDIYEVRVSGSPTQTGAFQPFTLNYEVRVARGSENSSPWLLYLFGAAAALFAAVFAYAIMRRPKGTASSDDLSDGSTKY